MRVHPVQLLFLTIALLLPACGGGSGGAENVDLSGWWVLLVQKTTTFVPLSVVRVEDEGATVWLEGDAYARDGDVLRGGDPDRVAPDRTEFDLTILSHDLVEGAGTEYVADAYVNSLPTRLTRTVTPDGTLTIEGLIDGVPINRSSTTAHAEQEAASAEHTLVLADSRPDGRSTVTLHFPVPAPLATGTWPLSDLVTEPVMTISTHGESGVSASGSVTFTSFDGGRVVGSYSASLVGGGAVSGVFDVPSILTTGP